MSFADNLRHQANEELLKREQATLDAQTAKENKKREFFATRNVAIHSGEAVSTFYAGFKQELMALASQRTSDISKHQNGIFIYLPKEWSKKEEDYNVRLKEREEHYKNTLDCTTSFGYSTSARISMVMEYFDIITPHKVFSKDECDIITKQLETFFSKDGLRCSCDYKKVYFDTYEEIELGRWKKHKGDLIGYTISFNANWYPWDTSKAISSQCLEKIRLDCLNVINKCGSPIKLCDSKILTTLGLENETIFLCEDTTLFHSGKEGFAITEKGISWIRKGTLNKLSYQELADTTRNVLCDLFGLYNEEISALYSRIIDAIRSDLM